jgi:hypothetical protein
MMNALSFGQSGGGRRALRRTPACAADRCKRTAADLGIGPNPPLARFWEFSNSVGRLLLIY